LNGGVPVNYQPIGSGSGIRQFNSGTIDFGATDKYIKDKDIERPVVQIPMTGGAIVPAYNYKGCDAKITQTQLADIFLGKIANWSSLGCSDKPITVVYRSDGSGTTAAFTHSLSSFSPEWKETVGHDKSVKWPVGVGEKGNAGVAARIKTMNGAIGYVNYGFIHSAKLQEASIQNRAGKFVKATAETASAGLSRIKLDDKLRGRNPNPIGKKSYPIVTLTWVLAHPIHPNNDIMKNVFKYMLSDPAQSLADGLGYVALPDVLKQKSLEVVETLQQPLDET